MNKKFLVTSPIAVLLCVAMVASLAPPVKANPSYLFSAVGYSTINGGYVGSYWNIAGTGPDNNWAQIYGGSAYTGGIIIGYMSTTVSSGSYIAIYVKAAAGYTSSVLNVYVSTSSSGPWTSAGSQTISTTSNGWYYFVAPQNFRYISLAGYGPAPVSIFIDSVLTM